MQILDRFVSSTIGYAYILKEAIFNYCLVKYFTDIVLFERAEDFSLYMIDAFIKDNREKGNTGISVEINPNETSSFEEHNENYVFNISKGEDLIMGVKNDGSGHFSGEIKAKEGQIANFNIKKINFVRIMLNSMILPEFILVKMGWGLEAVLKLKKMEI